MKPALLVLLSVLPVAALAAPDSPNSAVDAGHIAAVSANGQQNAAPVAASTDEVIDPLPVSTKKCMAVDKKGFCSQWAPN